MKNILNIIIFIGIIIAVVCALNYGWTKQDRINCNKWQVEANYYAGYWITENQKAQCDSLGIKVVAPVKKAF